MIGWALVLAAILTAVEWRVVRGNVGSEYNGMGAVLGTLERYNAAPMRYRVLIAWALRFALFLNGRAVLLRTWQYQTIKGLLLAGALAVAGYLVGGMGMVIVALLVAITFEFDYWDGYAEMIGVGLILTGGSAGVPWVAAVGGLLWGMSRETALLAPALGLLAGGILPGVAALTGPAILIVVRLVQGQAYLYCARWTWRVYNVPDLVNAPQRGDVGPALSIAWTVATVVAITVGRARMMSALATTAPLACVWLVAGWTMGRARETRIFLPTALWIVGALCT